MEEHEVERYKVTNGQYYTIDLRMRKIMAQLDQVDGSLFDPERVADSLQAIVEGEFSAGKANFLATSFTDTQALSRWTPEIDGFKDMLDSHRAIATDVLGLNGKVKIVWEIPPGFRIMNCLRIGHCYRDFDYINDWGIPDEVTGHKLVFMGPQLIKECHSETAMEQLETLAKYRNRYNLPNHHLTSFGSAPMLANIILSHHKLNYYTVLNERIPWNCESALTDTRLPDDSHLILGNFDASGLRCSRLQNDYWHPNVSCFALGVEELGEYS